MIIETITFLSPVLQRKVSTQSPSLEDIVQAIKMLKIETRDSLTCYISNRIYILLQAAEQKRVYIQWVNRDLLTAFLLDKELLGSPKEIQISDNQISPVSIEFTLAQSEAVYVIDYFYKNGKFPKDTLWTDDMSEWLDN